MTGWDVVFDDIYGVTIRLGPWSRRQADNLAYHQRLWLRTINDPSPVYVEPHKDEMEAAL